MLWQVCVARFEAGNDKGKFQVIIYDSNGVDAIILADNAKDARKLIQDIVDGWKM